MSGKWRALQHRHRYTYSAVIFPQSYADSLNSLSSHISSLKFYVELKQIAFLNSIYSQVNQAKNVALAFGELLVSGADEALVNEAARFYLEVLFFENSLPLHRTLVSGLAKIRNFHNVIKERFRVLCNEYGGVEGKGKRFSVSRVALSMMGTPRLGYLVEIVEECAVMVAWDVVLGLNCVVSETSDSSRPSPIVMEQCQEALSCSYYLFQRFPSKFCVFNGCVNEKSLVCENSNVLESIVSVILSILKSSAFSRDCYVAAGVSFCAALQVCLSPEKLGFVVMECIFHRATYNHVNGFKSDFENAVLSVPCKGDLYAEICKFSELSRLCLIRGILTAIPRTVLNALIVVSSIDNINGKGGNFCQSILFDRILPELCNYCEDPIDSHFNFHALTVMQICLQQIKTSMLSNVADMSEDYDPIPEEMGNRILKIIWNNLEDPLSQTVKQVHLIFDLFLDIQSSLHWAEGSEKTKSFLRKIASDLLRLGPRCKGRYFPLASLTKRLGAKSIFNLSPDILTQTVQAYADDDVCCAVTSFLKCFLENLRDECWSSDGIEKGYVIYRWHCLPPLLYGLASGFPKLRSNLNTYALPVVLEVDVDSIFPMLAFISIEKIGDENGLAYPELSFTTIDLTVEQKLAVLVSLLKVSRLLALIDGDIDFCDTSSECGDQIDVSNKNAILCLKGIKFKVPVEWFAMALTHLDETLRVDAAELLFLNPKTSSLPSHLELSLMREAVPLNMRCCSTAFQMKWASVFRKFLSRVKTALERQVKQGNWQPDEKNNEYVNGRTEDLFRFVKWLSCFLFFSCYPSAPYERKIMAMDLILIMIDVWSIVPSSEAILDPYHKGITLPDSTLLLVGSIVDSWDKLRESSFRILLHFPTPLPGISSHDMVQKVITWAKKLACSPRVRESDAGALTLRLIFRKYVLEQRWIIKASAFCIGAKSDDQINHNFQICESKYPVVEYINSLIDWLNDVVEQGEKDLYEACKNSFVHGVLLTLRYTFEELEWSSDIALSCIPNMRCALEKLLGLILRITSLALWVVSADAWCLPEDLDEIGCDDDFLVEVPLEANDSTSSIEKHGDVDSSKPMQNSRSAEQIIMVGCWLAMKEVSLLLGTIIRKIPLPTNTSVDLVKDVNTSNETTGTDAVLDLNQLETIGNHFLEVLLKMKHNGAIDKTRAGFTALCNRLLCSNDPRLCKLTESWMDQLMERTVAKGQVVDDLLRRSAGIPAAFTALFLSEPEGTPKKLLPHALRWLIDVANKSLSNLSGSNSMIENSCNTSKVRDEGVIPTVHAFNVLRAAFNDANLATDTSGFSAEALIISIRSFSSPYWEIRNSACLAYTALARRVIGFLNVRKRESARRALTGLEFFHRYPSLHTFLLNELKVATESLGESTLANAVHPSLCPILILLSRLKPSTITSETGDPLDPFLFTPFVRKCSTQSNLKVRVLASRALTGLISNEKLPVTLLNISSVLPIDGSHLLPSNVIQGTLLQLISLLDINCRNLADYSKKDQIIGDLIQVLLTHSWIGSIKWCPCPTLNTSFLRVLDHMLSIMRTCKGSSKNYGTVRNLLLKLSRETLDMEASCGLTYYDPTVPELRKQAAISYFSCVYQVSKEVAEEVQMPLEFSPLPLDSSKITDEPLIENGIFVGLPQMLTRSMSDDLYEVRLATLKWLYQFLKLTENQENEEIRLVYNWANTKLHDTLMQLLITEKHHKCTCYILKIIFTWNMLQFQNLDSRTVYLGSMDCDSVFMFWEKLVSLYKLVKHAKTQEALICCMGICIKRFASLLTDLIISAKGKSDPTWAHLYDPISYFVDVVKQHGDASEPVNMRKAAAESMVASGLLVQAKLIGSSVSNSYFDPNVGINTYAHKILDVWFICIKLLEDEDMGLRQKLAIDVQKLISSKKFGVVPSQVEKVIESSFEYLSSIFGHWVKYFDYLVLWVFNVANNVISSQGDLVRQVFDKEIDNHHEENILITQICCFHLEKLPNLESENYLREQRKRFYTQLTSFADDHILNLNGADWIGGVGNHKDAFLPVYANLLGIYVLSKCIFTRDAAIENAATMLSDIVKIGEKLSPFLKNPLISNLYLSVVELHEKMVGPVESVRRFEENGAIWDGFDLYFLLR